MSLLSVCEQFDSYVADADAAGKEFSILQDEISGVDLDDVERLAAAETLAAWDICCAAWSIVLSRHTAQSSLEFLSTALSHHQGARSIDKSTTWASVKASVDEDDTFSNFLHRSLKTSNPAALGDGPEVSSILVVGAGIIDDQPLIFPAALQENADIGLCVWSSRHKTVQISCTYHSRLPQAYIRRVVQHFLQALRHIANDMAWTSLCLQDISMMSLQEEMQLRQESLPGRSLAEFRYGSVHQLVRLQARKTPLAPALEGTGHSILSYQDMDLISDLMAEDLRLKLSDTDAEPLEAGPGLESALVVGVMLQRSPNVVISILSCWKAGLAVVILDPSHPISRNGHIINDCECALLLVDGPCEDDDSTRIAWTYDFQALRDRLETARDNPPPRYGSEIDPMKDFFRLAWIKVTSGSTGKSKGARHSHAALGIAFGSYDQVRGTKTLLFLNPVSAGSGVPMWSYLTHGGCVCVLPQAELTSDLAGCINRYGVDDLFTTPSALSLITPHEVPGLKIVSLLGETVPRSIGITWGPHVALRSDYGASEMNAHCFPLHDEPKGTLPPSNGFPTSDYSLYVLQPGRTTLCPFYVPGEICVSSTYISSGYVNRAEATSKAFVHHPFPGDTGHTQIYRTGDVGMLLGDHRFVLLGRVDFQFKIDGNRIQPEEVESIINQLPQVRKSRVVLVKPSIGRPASTCCVILNEASSNEASSESSWVNFISAARQLCLDRLPKYMVPHRWLWFEKFPETPTAKTDTKALAVEAKHIIDKQDLTSYNDSQQITQHLSKKGKLFLDLALRALTDEDPDTLPADVRNRMQNQPFITSGGSSLVALRLMNQLRKRKIELSLSQLYSNNSLANIAANIVEEETSGEKPADSGLGTSGITQALLPRLPAVFEPNLSDVEAIFPTAMLQREMLMLSILDPKLWILYQYFHLSDIDCTDSQVHEAVEELAAAKSNLRTVISLINVQSNPTMQESALETFNLIKNGNFVQAIMKPGSITVEITREGEIEEPEVHWKKDYPRGWSFEQPLWRVAFLSKPRLLAFTLHHAIVDEWIIENIPRHLYAILSAIMQRDKRQQGWQEALNDARQQARKPSIQPWIEDYYGTNGFDGTHTPRISKHTRVWGDFMADAAPTPIPDTRKLPYDALPAPPVAKTVKNLPYGAWCRQQNVTAAALFHTVNALTIARLLDWWRPSGPQHPPSDVTYYRLSSNRATTEGVPEMEGTPISINPMRVALSADANVTTVARSAMANWLATHESDPYYLDIDLVSTGPAPTDKRRRWGNVLLNHIINHADPADTRTPTFRDAIEGKCGFAMVWGFAALEMMVAEVDSAEADTVQLVMFSTLEDECNEEFMRVFEQTLRLVVEKGDEMSAVEVVQQT